MVRSEGNMSLKNPVTQLGIDPGTVGPVAQRLNHYAAPDPCTPGTVVDKYRERGEEKRGERRSANSKSKYSKMKPASVPLCPP